MRDNRDKGAIVVEASIALPVYVFVIFTILSIVNICYAQAKVQVALNSAVRQFSEMTYVAYAGGIAETGSPTGGKSSATAQQISTELNDAMKEWGVNNSTLSEMSEMIGQTSLSGIISNTVSTLAIKNLFEREFKLSKNGSSSGLAKWLKMDGEPTVHAVVTGNDVLVAGVYYEVNVIKLLNVDVKFQFHSGTISYLWTNERRSNTGIGSKKDE